MGTKSLQENMPTPADRHREALRVRNAGQKQAALAGFVLPALLSTIAVMTVPARQAHAQTNLATITGTVTDAGGGGLPNASVSIQNTDTTAVRVVMTDANGFYTAPSLTVGNYKITVSAPGFATAVQQAALSLGGLSQNIQMKVGNVSEQVTVSATSGAVALQTESHDLATSVDSVQLTTLPNGSRSILSIATLGPAAQAGTDASTSAGDQSFYQQTSNAVILSGLGPNQTQFLQDGIDNTNLLTQTANILASVEAAKEVNTTYSNAPAIFRQPAIVNAITKSGSNSFHGTVYDFLQNDAANAKNYFATTKPPVRYNLFGGNLGGPIFKNRIFGFFDYSGLRSHSSSLSQNRVPTAAERSGDFSADPVIYNPATYNSATGTSQPFANNKIPTLSAFAQLWLQNYPLPNAPLVNNINYRTNLASVSNYDEYLARGDWNVSSKNQLFGTVARFSSSGGANTITPGLFGISVPLTGTNASITDTQIINDHLVNALKIGYNRSNLFRTQQGLGAKNYANFYGLNNLNPSLSISTPPAIGVNNYTSLGDPYSPQGAIQNRYQFADQVTWTRGNHTITFGGEFIRVQFNGTWVVTNNGNYNFDGSATSQYVAGKRSSTNQGNALADLELGFPNTGSGLVGTSAGAFREFDVSGFLQDDWRATPRLTLNIGLRYDYVNPPTDKNNRGALYSLATNSNRPGSWNANYGDFGPRVGFSYKASNSTAIRGGYGIYYAPILYNNLQFMLLYSPNVVAQSYSLNIATPRNIQDLFIANPPSVPGQGGYSINPTLKDTSTQEWNLDVERTLGSSTMLTVQYLGNVTRHQSARADLNQPIAFSPGNTTGKLDVRPFPNAGPIDGQLNAYSANYNALGVKLDRKLSHDFQVLVAYTYQKALNVIDGDNSNQQNLYRPSLTYGPASFNRKHDINISPIYYLPFGPGKRFLNSNNIFNREIVGGWELAGLQYFASGQPISVTANKNADTSPYGNVYANLTCSSPTANFHRTRFNIFNPGCFAQPANGQYGTTRSVGSQPMIFQTNLSAIKNFQIYGEHQLQFRAEAFNLFNHPLFSTGGGGVTSPTLGVATSQSNSPRSMQFALRYSF
ncbi:carboxypeptidase regulatory-like domain-containing protein [Terriglobus roseus]|uniref:Carboxypeptidase regulatory-like domain-containing protein n=1 Tax=Terriglobus roseus TaxID=392734 RepID=A0A1H4JXL1_9BACT|nr:carboxypeptidase regulatory-like domain-containing protein [Terriglobus roseus]SEB50746.1 Carboxypeptidase regulatory-like domain-containing protein [Terriglobus roseus]